MWCPVSIVDQSHKASDPLPRRVWVPRGTGDISFIGARFPSSVKHRHEHAQ